MTLTYKDEETVRKIVSEEVKPLEKKIDRVITVLDGFAGNVQSMQHELTMTEGHKDQLENHEERLEIIEDNLQLASA